MRVLNVNALLDAASGGGAAERTLQLSRAFAAAGIDTTVLTLDLGIDAARRQALGDARLVTLPCLQRRFLVPRPESARLEALARAADVVHITGHWTPLNALAWRAAGRAGTPHVVCPAGALPVYGRSRALKRLFNAAVGTRLVREAAAWVAITDAERAQFAPYGVNPAQVTVIPNGVRLEELATHDVAGFRRRFGLGDHRLVLFMGRLNPIKGPDLLLEAFARLGAAAHGHHLVFAGPDEGLRAPLEQSAAARGIADRVHFTGHLGGADKASAYHAADLLAVPSRQEAMSIVALEAGACAKPVLMTDRCGFDEVGQAGGGRIVAADAAAIAAALGEMLTDVDALAAMGRRLQALVARRYTWAAAAQRYAELFDRIAGSAR